MIGPFEIVRKVSDLAFELKLPNNMRCHPVFHVSLLEPFHENDFPNRKRIRRKNFKLTTDTIEKIPERIIDRRTYNRKNRYLIRWKGLDSKEDTWIDEEQIFDKQLIQEYYRNLKKNKSFRTPEEFDQSSSSSNEYYVRHRPQPFTIDLPSNNHSRRSST